VAQIVEALVRELLLLQGALERVGDHVRVERRSGGACEHQPRFRPKAGGDLAFPSLPLPVLLESSYGDQRQRDDPPALPGLDVNEPEGAVGTLQRAADVQHRGREVDVLPFETESLPST
jgi:hypothetical protein